MNITLTRRSFLTATAVAGATAALCSKSEALSPALVPSPVPQNAGKVERIRSACRGCGKMECGVWVTVRDGRAIKIEGDESCHTSEGNCCTKSMASLQACYHPERLKYPMKRTRAKGDFPGWVRISWDEALHTSCTKFNEFKHKYGGESIFTIGGTSRIWSMAPYGCARNLFDSPNTHMAWQICKGPRRFATAFTAFHSANWVALVDGPKVYVQWGSATEISNYDDSGRVTVDRCFKAKKHIVVSPRMQNLDVMESLWLPLRCGTDAAMALAWMDVIVKNKLYDDQFCREWTNGPFLYCQEIQPTGWEWHAPKAKIMSGEVSTGGGEVELKTRLLKESDIKRGGDVKKFMVFDEKSKSLKWFNAETTKWEHNPPAIKPALFGAYPVTLANGKKVMCKTVFQLMADRAAQFAPEKSEKITGVPAAKVTEAAKIYASKPGNGGIPFMLGIEQSANSTSNVRALILLASITGNLDRPGGHRGPTVVPIRTVYTAHGAPPLSRAQQKKIIGVQKFPLLAWWNGWSDATALWDAVLSGKPYPLKGCFIQSGQLTNQTNTNKGRDAMRHVEFTLDLNLWFTPTNQYADIVVPVKHWLEVECPRMSQGAHYGMGAHTAPVKAGFERRDDQEIVLEMFKRMHVPFGEPENPWPTYQQQLDWTVAPTGMTWKQFKEKFEKDGWYNVKNLMPYERYKIGKLRLDGQPGFPTPTGKVEIWSTVIESVHPGHGWELPTFTEPGNSPVANPKLYKEYPLIMTSGRRIPVYFHSEHRQLPWCRELWPVPKCEIHPDVAKMYGLKQGDWIWIQSPWGRVRQTVDIYAGIRPDHINCEHQWWYPELGNEHEKQFTDKGSLLGDLNQLIDPYCQDPMNGSTCLRGTPVKIYKAIEGAPEGIIKSHDDKRLKQWLPVHEGRG